MADDTKTRYGVADPKDIAELSGREFLQGWIDGKFPAPPIGETMSMRLVEVADGFVAFEGEPGAHLLNPMGGIHGGWALTSCTTIETKGNFARPITTETGTVRAEGRVVSQTRQIISTEIRVTNQEGKILAHGTSTVMVLGRRE